MGTANPIADKKGNPNLSEIQVYELSVDDIFKIFDRGIPPEMVVP